MKTVVEAIMRARACMRETAKKEEAYMRAQKTGQHLKDAFTSWQLAQAAEARAHRAVTMTELAEHGIDVDGSTPDDMLEAHLMASGAR